MMIDQQIQATSPLRRRNSRVGYSARPLWPRLLLALLVALGGLRALAPDPSGATAVTWTYTSATDISINPNTGVVAPYPSQIAVSYLCGAITKVTATLQAVSHTYPGDLDILLVGPSGQKVKLMSDAGLYYNLSSDNLVFDDAAANALPKSSQIVAGTYKPSDYDGGDADTFPSAPSGGVTTTLSTFNGTSPNGTWRLYIADDYPNIEGGSVGGWQLHLTTNCAVLTVSGQGTVGVPHSPAGTTTSVAGSYGYGYGTSASISALPLAGNTLVTWVVDGAPKGWANPLTITMNTDHSAQAVAKPAVTFADTPSGRADYAAIVALASRGYIRGYNASAFGPDDGVQRAQMAALIARAMSAGPGIPPQTVTPLVCTVAGTWDCEVWPNTFADQNGLDSNLWRDVAALQHYGVAKGYSGADCAARGLPSPCFVPTAPVSYAETIVFVTRAMVAKGYWQNQPGAPQPYAGVPAIFATEAATFHFYTAGQGGIPAPPADWNGGATRGWFAQALWAALDSYWGKDGLLPDGKPAGGYVP